MHVCVCVCVYVRLCGSVKTLKSELCVNKVNSVARRPAVVDVLSYQPSQNSPVMESLKKKKFFTFGVLFLFSLNWKLEGLLYL